jgi:hypothetical protein
MSVFKVGLLVPDFGCSKIRMLWRDCLECGGGGIMRNAVLSKRFAGTVIRAGWIVLLLILPGCSHSKEIKTLIELGKDAGAQDEIVAGETKSFKKICEALQKKKIFAGTDREKILRKYGAPVIETVKDGAKTDVYKVGNSTWFDDKKIYLTFDSSDKLLRWQSQSDACVLEQK